MTHPRAYLIFDPERGETFGLHFGRTAAEALDELDELQQELGRDREDGWLTKLQAIELLLADGAAPVADPPAVPTGAPSYDFVHFDHGTLKTSIRLHGVGGPVVSVDHRPREFGLPEQLASDSPIAEVIHRLNVLRRKHRDEITRLTDYNTDLEATIARLRAIAIGQGFPP